MVDTPIRPEERVAMMETTDAGGNTTESAGDNIVEKKADAGEGSSVPEVAEPEWVGHLRSIDTILGGNKTIALHQEFLIRNNNTDLQILKNTKVSSQRLLGESAE